MAYSGFMGGYSAPACSGYFSPMPSRATGTVTFSGATSFTPTANDGLVRRINRSKYPLVDRWSLRWHVPFTGLPLEVFDQMIQYADAAHAAPGGLTDFSHQQLTLALRQKKDVLARGPQLQTSAGAYTWHNYSFVDFNRRSITAIRDHLKQFEQLLDEGWIDIVYTGQQFVLFYRRDPYPFFKDYALVFKAVTDERSPRKNGFKLHEPYMTLKDA